MGIETVLITSGMKGKQKLEVLSRVADGRANIVIGTHAVIQDKVEFARLGLGIIDEQQSVLWESLAVFSKWGRGSIMGEQSIGKYNQVCARAALSSDSRQIGGIAMGKRPRGTVQKTRRILQCRMAPRIDEAPGELSSERLGHCNVGGVSVAEEHRGFRGKEFREHCLQFLIDRVVSRGDS
jgi:hypothetical protein